MAALPFCCFTAAMAAGMALAAPASSSSEERADGQPGVRLSWVRDPSASDCPNAAAVEADTVQRLGHDPFAKRPFHFVEGLASREMDLYRVTISMRDGDDKLLGSRVLSSAAPDCRAVATAAALTIAILIDPDALARATELRPTQAERPSADRPPPAAEVRPAARPAWNGRVVAMGLGAWGVLPDAAVGGGLSATAAAGRRTAAGAILGFLPEQRSTIVGGDFAFGSSFAQVVGCFVPYSALVRWEVCGGGVVSVLHVVVYSPVPEAPGQRWSVGATEMTRLIMRLVGPAVLEVGVAATEQWPRRAFFIAGRQPGNDIVFTQPPVALAGWMGLGVKWE